MKKYLIILLVLAFAVSMVFMGTACKQEAAPAAAEEEAAPAEAEEEEAEEEEVADEEVEEITLTMWTHHNEEAKIKYWEFWKSNFEEDNPGVTIEYETYQAEAYSQVIKAALALSP